MIKQIVKKIKEMHGAKATVKIVRNGECIAIVEVTAAGLEIDPQMIEKSCTGGLIALTKLDRNEYYHGR